MFEQGLKELELISKAIGKNIDYVQGGGGNTSVKLDDKHMAVKASGFKLNQITISQGFVIVNHENIKSYYENVDLSHDVDFEKESVEIARRNVIDIDGLQVLRPSVEAGFHSILKKYVIHTHPVYVNILCCSKEGKALMEKIFGNREYVSLWIPYINPGFCLTLKIKEGIDQSLNERGKFPEVYFMENHGLIVTSDSYQRAVELHEEINEQIRQYLQLPQQYPEIELEEIEDEVFVSRTAFLNDFFAGTKADLKYFEKNSLYPDQLVYLNTSLSVDGACNKLNVDTAKGERIYKTNYSEAITIEETLLGYAYVLTNIEKFGLKLKSMSEKEVDFIKNWESEAYRKSLVKKLVK